jgi:hypothetical protein
MLWTICRAFNVLPSEPSFRRLEPLQLMWIYTNLGAELENMSKGNGTQQKMEMSDEDFTDVIAQIKAGK